MTGATCKGLVTEEYTSDRVRCKMNEEKKKKNKLHKSVKAPFVLSKL